MVHTVLPNVQITIILEMEAVQMAVSHYVTQIATTHAVLYAGLTATIYALPHAKRFVNEVV